MLAAKLKVVIMDKLDYKLLELKLVPGIEAISVNMLNTESM